MCACLCVLSCRVKKVGAVPDPLHICPCTICTFAMCLESVDFVLHMNFTMYIKINALKFMNIYCSQYIGLQLFVPSLYFQLTCFIVPLTCKL